MPPITAKTGTPQTTPLRQVSEFGGSLYDAILRALNGVDAPVIGPVGDALSRFVPQDTPEQLTGNLMGPLGMATGPLMGPGAKMARKVAQGVPKLVRAGATLVKVPHDLTPARTDIDAALKNVTAGNPHPYYATADTLSDTGLQREYYRLRGTKQAAGTDIPAQIRVLEDVAKQRNLPLGTQTTIRAGAGAAMTRQGIKQTVRAGARRIANPIKAHHGSPHDFEAFDITKVGTGQGEARRGHGLNFAQDPEISAAYRGPQGHGYDVDLHVTPEELIDWDMPLREQSQTVQKAMADLGIRNDEQLRQLATSEAGAQALKDRGVAGTQNLDVGSRGAASRADRWVVSNTAADGRTVNSFTFPSEADAQKFLQSREYQKQAKQYGYATSDVELVPATPGTRNFVIFDDQLIEIARKYGIPLAVAQQLVQQQGGTIHSRGADQ